MKYLNNILYLEHKEATDCGIPKRTMDKWSDPLKVVDPEKKSKRLIEFEGLKHRYKILVHAKFGDPYQYVAKAPVKSLLKEDLEAHKFYSDHRFGNDEGLPPQYVPRYAMAASWLNMLRTVMADKKLLKRTLNVTLDQFWGIVEDIISSEDIALPRSYKRLRAKMEEYAKEGYSCLIDWRFGNRNASKVTDEISEALLFEMIAHPNQHDDATIASQYNAWAVSNDHKDITHGTVANYRLKHEYLLMQEREGGKNWLNTYGKVITRSRPSAPLLLINSDDNVLDLFFIDTDKSGQGKYYTRLTGIFVIDAYNDYLLGYAIGREVSTGLVRAAYLDAMHHIRQLTGEYYLPHQIQTDRWALKELTPFYESLGNFFPASAKVARAKYIERFFGDPWHKELKFFNNYSGHNISAKTRGVNDESLELRKKDFPTLEEAPQVIAEFVNRLRSQANKEGITRQQQWLTAFNSSDKSRERQINDELMLLKTGIRHMNSQGGVNQITNRGITFQLSNRRYTYDIPDHQYLQNVGKYVHIIYDPYDLSRILVTDDHTTRFICQANMPVPSALADFREGDRHRLNEIFAQKYDHVEQIGNAKAKRQAILKQAKIDAESMLQAGVLVKEIKQAAEAAYQLPAADDNYEPVSIWDKV